MESKKINQLATEMAPATSDLTIIGDPITGVSKKITLLQIADLFGTTGTVSSVAVTETGDALTITGSPITSAGTINIGFAGDATQYVRGDGALADFPTSTGGGSSVSYYLNSSVSQGTIGGVAYRELSKDPISGAGTDITISANGYIASYITDANDPALLEVPGGNFNCEFYFNVNSNAHNPYVYAELYKYDGTTFTLLGSSQSVPEYLTNGTTLSPYYFAIPVATAALTITDRLAVRIYVNVDGKTVTLHTENNHLCQVVTTFSKGLTSLNNLTRQVQFFGTGTSGTDFAISSSVATHTFNLPVASAANTGKLSSTDWSTFNNKLSTATAASTYVPYTGATTNVDLGDNNLSGKSVLINGNNTTTIGFLGFRQGSGGSIGQFGYTSIYVENQTTLYFNYSTGSTTSKRAGFSSSLITNDTERVYNLPNASGTLALTSDISYPVTSVFGRTGAVVATEGDYSLTQLSDVTITTPSSGQVLKYNGTAWINDTDANTGTVTSVGLSSATSGVTIGSSPITTSGTITLAIATASGSQNGLLSSTDWTTFNNKQSALTNPVTGTGTTNTLPKFTAASTIGNSNVSDSGTLITLGSNTYVNGYVLIGTATDSGYKLDVNGTGRFNGNLYIGTADEDTKSLIINGTGASTSATIYFDTSSKTFGLFQVGTQKNYLTGSLGIGTSAPTEGLVVANSSLRVTGQANNFGTGSRGVSIDTITSSGNGRIYMVDGTGTAGDLLLGTANTERARITSNGNFLIGTTTNANVDYKLSAGNSLITKSYGGSGAVTTNIAVPGGEVGLFFARGYDNTSGVSFSVIYNVAIRVGGGGGADVYSIVVSQNGATKTFTFDNNGGFLRITPSANTQWSGTFLGVL